MQFSNPNEHEETGIELTPLIDVVFLLLIFFMISTTFTKESALRINLPQANQEKQDLAPPRKLELYIGENSAYALKSENDKSAVSLVNSNRDTLSRALQPYRCLLYTSPSPRDLSTSRMPSSA